jgi:hypothetical protein
MGLSGLRKWETRTGARIVFGGCTAALTPPRDGARVYLNASSLSADSQLAVEILNESLRPVPGYAAADCTPIKDETGLRDSDLLGW